MFVEEVRGTIFLAIGAEKLILPVNFESRNALPALG